ncbi:MAG: hypothetical protein LUD17_15195 [Bacteroidales bacterium]|nr:hypothetical protein [Bacteroidales bacterium]
MEQVPVPVFHFHTFKPRLHVAEGDALEIGGHGLAAVDAREPDRHGRQRGEPVEVRQQGGKRARRGLKEGVALFEQPRAVGLLAYYLGA